MARNYGKKTRRYAVGGIVPKEADDEEPLQKHLYRHRMDDIIDRGKGLPEEYELEENRNKVLDQRPDLFEGRDIDPDDYLKPEDQDI